MDTISNNGLGVMDLVAFAAGLSWAVSLPLLVHLGEAAPGIVYLLYAMGVATTAIAWVRAATRIKALSGPAPRVGIAVMIVGLTAMLLLLPFAAIAGLVVLAGAGLLGAGLVFGPSSAGSVQPTATLLLIPPALLLATLLAPMGSDIRFGITVWTTALGIGGATSSLAFATWRD